MVGKCYTLLFYKQDIDSYDCIIFGISFDGWPRLGGCLDETYPILSDN